MIYELDKSQYHKVDHMPKGDLINLEIKSVVEGYNPGWVFVDNIEQPKTAMVWSRGIQGFYFIGDSNNPAFNDYINQYIDEEITPRAKALGYHHFEFSGTSKEWDEAFIEIFNGRRLDKSKQFVYMLKNCHNPIYNHYNIGLGEGYIVKEVKELKEDLIKSNIYSLDFVRTAILQWWDTIDDFLEHGEGFCILYNHTAVCSCVTSFMTDHNMESHIVTHEIVNGNILMSTNVLK